MSPVRSHPSRNFSGSSTPKYEPVIHGPLISNSPTVLPSFGRTVPSSAVTLILTPATIRPALTRQSISCSFGVPNGGIETAARGLVSVIPHPWMMSMPYLSRYVSMSTRGTADPPASK